MTVDVLDPSSQPQRIVHKMVIDATTPVPPDTRGNFVYASQHLNLR